MIVGEDKLIPYIRTKEAKNINENLEGLKNYIKDFSNLKEKVLKKERSGFGHATLEHRLRIIYKNNFKLDKFVENDVYIAHLKIDLLEYKTEMLAAGR